jgi:hypothetical protein
MRRKWVLFAPMAIAGVLLVAAIGGGIVQLLWNWLLPPLFEWRTITFWQGLGLLALCRILFGGFARHGFPNSGSRGRMADRIAERVADRMGERWEAMTPEERERFRQRLRARCGGGTASPDASKG